jgi:hypothetical protein
MVAIALAALSPVGAAGAPGPAWAVSPAEAGPDAPPAGRSLFDFVVSRDAGGRRVYDVPFPFEALVARLVTRAGCSAAEACVRQVLIPLGRSLQRTAAAPDYFAAPRVVAAIDREGSRGAAPLLKDRVYLGYQERSDIVEVISWNEAAGRFEFQLVRDYRAGGTPEVLYARRAVCAACHQNLAPIFSRQVWEETNANPRIAALLAHAHAGAAVYGVPIRTGLDVPNAIDDATDRANLFGITQRLWREACGDDEEAGRRCRGAVLAAAIQFRLTGERTFDTAAVEWREAFAPAFARAWDARWPGGLAIPNPDVPNRDPLPPEGAPAVAGLAASHVSAVFEPLTPRPPLATWAAATPEVARAFVAGLAAHLGEADVRAIERALAARPGTAVRRFESRCELRWSDAALRFDCQPADAAASTALRIAGHATLAGERVTGGEVTAVAVAGAAPLHNLQLSSGRLDARSGRLALQAATRWSTARLADGAAIVGLELRWDGAQARSAGVREATATATLTVRDEFPPVREVIAALAGEPTGVLAARPFSRARVLPALFVRLGIRAEEWCCDEVRGMPPAAVEPVAVPLPGGGPAKDVVAFYPLCASCHATGERFPPNFLAGSGERVTEAVRHCAPRIYARLALWRVAPETREKTPMPPPMPLPRGEGYAPPLGLVALERTASDLLQAESGAAPRLDALLANGYETLRPCLPR